MSTAETPLHPMVEYGLKSKTHVWAVTTIKAVGDDFLDHLDARIVGNDHPDADIFPAATDILGQVIDCILCEQPYDTITRRRKCPGRRLHPGIKRST